MLRTSFTPSTVLTASSALAFSSAVRTLPCKVMRPFTVSTLMVPPRSPSVASRAILALVVIQASRVLARAARVPVSARTAASAAPPIHVATRITLSLQGTGRAPRARSGREPSPPRAPRPRRDLHEHVSRHAARTLSRRRPGGLGTFYKGIKAIWGCRLSRAQRPAAPVAQGSPARLPARQQERDVGQCAVGGPRRALFRRRRRIHREPESDELEQRARSELNTLAGRRSWLDGRPRGDLGLGVPGQAVQPHSKSSARSRARRAGAVCLGPTPCV